MCVGISTILALVESVSAVCFLSSSLVCSCNIYVVFVVCSLSCFRVWMCSFWVEFSADESFVPWILLLPKIKNVISSFLKV
jgi:hypothetical protein